MSAPHLKGGGVLDYRSPNLRRPACDQDVPYGMRRLGPNPFFHNAVDDGRLHNQRFRAH